MGDSTIENDYVLSNFVFISTFEFEMHLNRIGIYLCRNIEHREETIIDRLYQLWGLEMMRFCIEFNVPLNELKQDGLGVHLYCIFPQKNTKK